MAYTTPTQSYYQEIIGTLRNEQYTGTAGRGILGSLGESILPTEGIAALQSGATRSQLGLVGTQLALSNAYQEMLGKFTLSNLGISRAQLGIQGTTLAEKQAETTAQNKLEQQQYAVTATRFPEEYAQAALTHRNTLQNTRGQNATSGAGGGATGTKETMTTIAQKYGFTLQTIARAQKLSTLGQQSTLEAQKYTTEQLANAQKNLGLLAESNGLSQQEVMTRLNYALSQNQLGAYQTVVSLLTKLGSIWTGAELNAGTTLGLGGFVSGMNLFSPAVTTTQIERGTQNRRALMGA